MAANRAALIDTINRRRDKDTSVSDSKTTGLRLAPSDGRASGRVRQLVALATSLMKEVQVLARDKAFVDESLNLQSLDLAKGIDFYIEVQRFETALIKLALEQADGNQAQAARLLGLRATTLNSKIKLYGIEY